MAACIEIVIPDNDGNDSFAKDDKVVSSTSLFEVSRLATLDCKGLPKGAPSGSIVWNNYSDNLVVATGKNVTSLRVGDCVKKVFNNVIPGEHNLKAISSLPSSHIIVGLTSENAIVFFDGVKGTVAELSLKVPEFVQPVIHCHRWENYTYIIVTGKGPQKTVWVTLSGPVSSYEKCNDLAETIDSLSTSGIADFSLDGFTVAFKPESNTLYAFAKEPDSSNSYYNLSPEGIFIHRKAYSVRGYTSVTMTPSFAFALSTDGCLDIFDTRTLFVCKELLLKSENAMEPEVLHAMQITATSKTCSLEGLYMLLSVSTNGKRQLQIRLVQTNDIVCSVDCNGASEFLRYDSALSVMSFVEIDDRQLALKVITEATPDLKVEKLISMKKFDEALELAKKFSVSFDPIYKAKASDLLDKIRDCGSEDVDDVTTLYGILKKIKDQDAFCDLCLEGILSLNMFNVVRKLLDMALDTKTKNSYIVEQLNSISASFTTVRMIFTQEQFADQWLSIVTQRTTMYTLMADACEAGNFKTASIIWNHHILKPEFNSQVTRESAGKMLKVFAFFALDRNFRADLMKFMEKDFMPYALITYGSGIGCAYAEALVEVIDGLEYEEGEDYCSIAYYMSLSLDRISKCLKERALTPSEKCLLVDIRTSMGYDSYNEEDTLGTLNMRKENLLRMVNLKERYNLSFKYKEFIGLSNEDIGVHIVEKMLLMEDEMETIYSGILKPYCVEFMLDHKSLICDFVGKWSAQQTFITGDVKVGMLKNKVSSICRLVGKINDPVLQIRCLQDLADAVPYNWPKELIQSVYSILVDNAIAKDVKSDLADRCRFSEICQIIKVYKDVPYDIENIVRYRTQFAHLIQSISVDARTGNIEVLAKDMMKLCQLRHLYCKFPGTFNVSYSYIYEQLWIPHLIKWRSSGFEKKEPMMWLHSLPNVEAQEIVARYSVDYLLGSYKRVEHEFKAPEEISRYLKTLSVIKSFILNYLFKVKKYKQILDKIYSIESIYSRTKILKSPKYFLESPKDSADFMNELISTYGVSDWIRLLEIAKITRMDSVLALKHLLNACLKSSQINQASAILFTVSLDSDSLSREMLSMIKVVLDGIFLKIHESSAERSFNLSSCVNMFMLALKVFIAEADPLDVCNFGDLLEFSKYHKFLNIIKDMVDSTEPFEPMDDTTDVMDTSDSLFNKDIPWEMHPLAHLLKPVKVQYNITTNRRSKPFTRSCLQLPMNGENNIETLLSIAGSIVENVEPDVLKTRDYVDGWKNIFNQLLMDGQFYDVLNLVEIYNTLTISKVEDIGIRQFVKHATIGLLEKILLIPDCDLEFAASVVNSAPESDVPSILQEIRNCFKTNSNPRVYINLCELVGMVYHKIPQVGMIEMLTKRYDESVWRRKLSKFGFNFSSRMTLSDVIHSLVRCNVPHDIAHEYSVYYGIDLNTFRLQCALESCLYSSELLEMNETAKHAEQLKRSSTLLSISSITKEHFPQIEDAIMKMSPYNHEGILLLIDKALEIFRDDNESNPVVVQLYDWRFVISFVMSYGKRSSEILPIECTWLSTLKSFLGTGSSTSFNSVESNQSVGELSMIEYEVMEEKREAARKRMPQCAVQRLPFHLLCCTDEKDVKQYVSPVIFNEIDINNVAKWIGLIVNTISVLRLNQSECIFTAINKRIKYVDENDIHVGEIDRGWITSAIQCVDESKVATIVRYSSKYAINLRNLNIKIAFLNILKDIAYTTAELLEGDKKEELEKYGKELARRIVKYSVEKILSDNRLLDEEAKGCLSSGKIPELIRYVYGSLIDWNNYQDRRVKMEACMEIARITDINLSSIHSTIIDGLLVQETVSQVGDPDATLNTTADMEIGVVNQGVDNRLECGILDDDANVSKIVHILCTGDYSAMVKKMFGILNKDPKILPGGIITLIKIILCICRLYPRKGEKPECFKAKKSQVLIALKGAYYYHMLNTINVNCKMVDLMSENNILEILKQLQNSPVHSTEKDFVVVNIMRDYAKKTPKYSSYMKTYLPRMIMGRQFSIACCILSDSTAPLTSDHMGCNILQFVLKTIEGVLKQNPNNIEIVEDMLRFMMKYSISFGYPRPPRETGLFSCNQDMSKIAHYILNPTGN
uniref:WD_REPEATS_REGION domain-containing protein n=1 Tax=Strongyloides papillosus TaxID=174720 RepID=A0A0N5BTM4_STREA